MILGYDYNEYGVRYTRLRCDVCGQEFTLTPAVTRDDTCGRPPGCDGPDDPGCVSYDRSRDVSALLSDGAELIARPLQRGES
jgi:hypothetical protein